MGERVAIIGGGVAGLSAAYLLNQKHQITLFEKDDRVGGNAHTLTTRDGLNFDIAVAVFGKMRLLGDGDEQERSVCPSCACIAVAKMPATPSPRNAAKIVVVGRSVW